MSGHELQGKLLWGFSFLFLLFPTFISVQLWPLESFYCLSAYLFQANKSLSVQLTNTRKTDENGWKENILQTHCIAAHFQIDETKKKKIKNTFTDKPTIEEINEATQKC